MEVNNAIVEENQKPGNPESEWGLPNGASSAIEGFTTDISTNVGGAVDFKIDSDAAHYRIDIYRLGYYDGDGARLVGSIEHNSSTLNGQPAPVVDLSTGLVDAGNWHVTDSWQIPDDAVSGVYIAKLVREDGVQGENQVPFIVRNDASHSDIVFQTSDTTWQAYNSWGGANLYGSSLNNPQLGDPSTPDPHRAYAVSYNRPLDTHVVNSSIFSGEYAAIRWLEQNGYDVTYQSGIDTALNGNLLLNHKVFMDAGHDEYWIGDQRANVEAARDAGVNLAFLTGNEVYWRTRLDAGVDGTANRTLVSYKESWDGTKIDPSPEWTGSWRDPNAPGGANPENSLTGGMFMVNNELSSIEVGYEFSQQRMWANTSIADLQPGQTAVLDHLLGYEWDVDADNGSRPAGLINLSSTTVTVPTLIQGTDLNMITGEATHSLNMYKAASGAVVFGAGTIFWSWGLDSHHTNFPGLDADNVPVNRDVQQLTVNVLAQMGVQPASLQPDLVHGTPSDDFSAPTSVSLALSGTPVLGHPVTISGTAVDVGGGVVAGTEVSTDGGSTWHKAAGTAQWTYSWVPTAVGATTILARSVDDSLNLGTPISHDVSVTNAIEVAENSTAVTLIGIDSASVNLDLLSLASSACCACGLCAAATATDSGSNLQTLADAAAVLPFLTISGGADAALFTIDSNTGELSFISAPDFENPADANHDNLYEVTVQVTHGAYTNSLPYAIDVNNVTPETQVGDAGDNIFLGSADRESFFGQGGLDSVSYALVKSAVTASLAKPGLNTGAAVNDTYSSIEGLTGSSFKDTLIGDAGANILEGGPGADKLDGGSGSDTASYEHAWSGVTANLGNPKGNTGDAAGDTYTSIENLVGSQFDDLLYGNSGNNVLSGLGGNDYLNGTTGADRMIGGLGNDVYVVDNSGDVVDETGGDGNDLVQSSISFNLANTARVVGEVEWLALTGTGAISGTGNALSNALIGNAGNNVLAGLGGSDYIDGGGGTDTATYAASFAGVNVSLGLGSGSGADAEGDVLVNIENLIGSTFDDTIKGSAGNNVLNGGLNGSGGDTVSYADAASVSSSVTGVGVTVSLAITSAQNTVIAGKDTLSGFENLTGSGFDDKLTGNSGNNVLTGLAGNDMIDGGTGADRMIGGFGDDIYTVDNAEDVVDESDGDGADTVRSAITFSLSDAAHALGSIENLTLTGKTSIGGTGNDLNNIMMGNDASNVLVGLGGADYLDGAAGADRMIGGLGDDIYVVNHAGDVADETGGDGNDLVLSSVSFNLADPAHAVGDVEWLLLTGGGSISGTGNALSNALIGNGGNNVLAGLGGGDYIDGGGGTDTATYAASSTGVTVSLMTGVASGGDAEGDFIVNVENLTGSNFDDVLEGNAGNNVLNGGLNGPDGDTVSYANAYPGANGLGVTVSLAITSAQNTVTAGKDTLIGFENLTGSEFNDKLTGNSGNNVLHGLAGNDTIDGGTGADTIIGGLGADTLIGGTGRDLFAYVSAAEGGDTIKDFVVSDDTLVFSASGFGGGLTGGQQLVAGVSFIADASPIATTDFGTFLYNTTTHDLTWDVDGSGATDAVQIAHFNTAVSLSADHFNITA